MNVSKLVDVVAKQTGSTKTATREVLKAAFQAISKSVKEGERVSVVGFGSFYPLQCKARTGRNPQTGEAVKIPAARVPRFKAGKNFREAVRRARKRA